MAVRIVPTCGRHRDPRRHGIDERLGGGGPAAVVGDLEQIDPRQTGGQQAWVDAVLHVARQQESPLADRAQQDDRNVVDAGPIIGRLAGHLAGHRPQDLQLDRVHGQAITGGEAGAWRCAGIGQALVPGGVARAGSEHARFEDPPDAVAVEQQGEASHVVLVRVGEDDDIDAPVPGRDAPIELDEQTIGIGPAIDEQPSPRPTFDQDGVTLSDVQDGHPGDAGRP
jgi:hypothetical protein